jgi:predicted secreted hydrolase
MYAPDPVAKGQFWHYVAHLRDDLNNEYGVQLSIFRVHGEAFVHCAYTDVARNRFIYQEQQIGRNGMSANQTDKGHDIDFDCRGTRIALHAEITPPRGYGCDTSIHYGYPRMECKGMIGRKDVRGTMCFDRETFNKLMLPNEVGWDWMVLWLDDGRTLIRYAMVDEDLEVTRIRFGCDDVDTALLKIDPMIEGQYWPKNDKRMFGYTEALCNVTYDGVTGHGYLERVGMDGKVEL